MLPLYKCKFLQIFVKTAYYITYSDLCHNEQYMAGGTVIVRGTIGAKLF